MQIVSTFHLVFCRKRPQATVRPSWREESAEKEETEETGTEQKRFSPFHQFYNVKFTFIWKKVKLDEREEVFYFSLVLHLSEEKEEDGTEQKSFFPLVLHSLSMFSSLAEVIEVAIRAEYQVGVQCGDSQPNVSNVFQCWPWKWTQSQGCPSE